MQYVQSKDIAKYWREINFKPDYKTNIYCIYNNELMTLPEKLAAYKNVIEESGENLPELEEYIKNSEETIERFRKDELSEDVIYYCRDIFNGNIQYFFDKNSFNTFYELQFHIRKWCEECDIPRVEFFVDKIYPKLQCKTISADYRFESDKFEITDISGGSIVFPRYDFDFENLPLPYSNGDILINNADGTIIVVGEDEKCEMYYSLTRYDDVYRYEYNVGTGFEFLHCEDFKKFSSAYLPLFQIAAYIKCGQLVPEELYFDGTISFDEEDVFD